MKNNLLERLRNRVDVYSKIEGRTEFGEITYDYNLISTVWAEIKPISGKEEKVEGNSIKENISHKFTIRKGSIKEPRNDMYFIFQGQKYEVMYFMPFYNGNDLVEFYCKLVIETEEDY